MQFQDQRRARNQTPTSTTEFTSIMAALGDVLTTSSDAPKASVSVEPNSQFVQELRMVAEQPSDMVLYTPDGAGFIAQVHGEALTVDSDGESYQITDITLDQVEMLQAHGYLSSHEE